MEILSMWGGGGGSQKPNFYKESIALNWIFQRGGGIQTKNLPWEGYGYFLEQHIARRIYMLVTPGPEACQCEILVTVAAITESMGWATQNLG